MSNPLMGMFNAPMAQLNHFTDPSKMVSQFQQFKRSFTGNPEQQVRQLLATGQMTQAQFQQLSQMANSLMPLFK